MIFYDIPSVVSFFHECDENDLFITSLGYNNFNYLKSSRSFGVQRFYTIHIVIDGTGYLEVANQQYTAKSGDMFFIPPNVSYRYYSDEDNPWEYVWFSFVGDNSELYCEKFGFDEENHLIKCKDFPHVKVILQRLFDKKLNNNSLGYYDILSGFYKILNIHIQEDNHIGKTELSESIANYVNCHYNKPELSLPELCNYFNISHPSLCRIFKEKNGYSVKTYIIKTRINEALKLLANTNLNVKDIAFSVGYLDDIQFMKMFKKETGLTPSEYRKSIKSQLIN